MAACQVFAPAPHVVRLDGTKRAHSRSDCAGSESHHALPDIRCRSTDEAQLHVLQLVKAHRRSVKKLFQCNRSAWLMSDMRLVADLPNETSILKMTRSLPLPFLTESSLSSPNALAVLFERGKYQP